MGILFVMWMLSYSDQGTTKPLVLGEVVTLDSKSLSEQRTLNIYLPKSYGTSEKKYPVLFVLDGSMDEDFIHIAGLTQFCSFSWVNYIPEMIVVGVANVDRKRDFTFPTDDPELHKEFPTAGRSADFITFLVEEAKPLLEKNYRTSTFSLLGQSFGGLLAAQIAVEHPAAFQNVLIVSPSLWWDNQSLLNKPFSENKPDSLRVFLAVGKEGEVMEGDTRKFLKKLQGQTWIQASFIFLEDQDHGNILHLAAYQMFEKWSKPDLGL